MNLEERFWSKVAVPSEDECWVWLDHCAVRGGYGVINVNRVTTKAHRLAFELATGISPKGFFVLHSCDNPPCVNPSHLRLGTNRDNVHDMLERGRHVAPKRGVTHCKWGHEYTEENTYVAKAGNRQCRTCNRDKAKRYYWEKKK